MKNQTILASALALLIIAIYSQIAITYTDTGNIVAVSAIDKYRLANTHNGEICYVDRDYNNGYTVCFKSGIKGEVIIN